MNAMEFVQASILGLHNTLLEDMKDLSQEVLEWRPQEDANPIGSIFIHYMKTEDNVVHRLQNESPIWESDEWREKLATNDLSNTLNEHGHPRLLPLSPSLSYAQQVMDNTRKFLETLEDSKLDIAPDPNHPLRTIGVVLRAFVLSHGWWHAGEIKYLKGLQGMPQHA